MEMTDGAVTNPTSGASIELPGLTQVQRILYTFTAPSRTFLDLLRNTSWWMPFLLSVVLSYAFVFAMQSHVGWEKVSEANLKQNTKAAEQMASLPADQRARAMQMSMNVTKGIYYGLPVLSLLLTAIFALVLWGTINFVFGGHATYGQVFAVWMYGSLPLLVFQLLAILTMFAGVDADAFNPQNPVGSNIGYYLPQEIPKWLHTFASAMDIFWIWSLILVGIGLAIVAKVKRSSGLIAVFGWAAIVLILRMAFAGITG